MRSLGWALALWGSACVTSSSPLAPEHAYPRARAEAARALAAFSAGLAQAGMSVPLPPRVCEDPSLDVVFDERRQCVAIPAAGAAAGSAARAALLETYARALVRARLPEAPPARADALARAWSTADVSFMKLATDVERDFDARRLPATSEPAAGAPVTGEPAITGSAVTGSAVTGSAVTDPAVTDPAVTDPTVTDPAADDAVELDDIELELVPDG